MARGLIEHLVCPKSATLQRKFIPGDLSAVAAIPAVQGFLNVQVASLAPKLNSGLRFGFRV